MPAPPPVTVSKTLSASPKHPSSSKTREAEAKEKLYDWFLHHVGLFTERNAEYCAGKCLELDCNSPELLGQEYLLRKRENRVNEFLELLTTRPLRPALLDALEQAFGVAGGQEPQRLDSAAAINIVNAAASAVPTVPEATLFYSARPAVIVVDNAAAAQDGKKQEEVRLRGVSDTFQYAFAINANAAFIDCIAGYRRACPRAGRERRRLTRKCKKRFCASQRSRCQECRERSHCTDPERVATTKEAVLEATDSGE